MLRGHMLHAALASGERFVVAGFEKSVGIVVLARGCKVVELYKAHAHTTHTTAQRC